MVRQYGLIGFPLGHSFSAKYFTEKFAREGILDSYDLYPIPSVSELPSLLNSHPTLEGLNVTIPYKREVIPYLDCIDEKAAEIGAVNVIKVVRDNGRHILKGYNSDAPAFQETFEKLNLDKIRMAIILGTGGASDAVASALSLLDIDLQKVSRTKSDKGTCRYEDLTEDMVRDAKLIVNTTPVGMYPDIDRFPPFPFGFLTSDHICYDLVYNPAVTSFMKRAAEHGAWVKNGLDMLYKQAEISWEIWNS